MKASELKIDIEDFCINSISIRQARECVDILEQFVKGVFIEGTSLYYESIEKIKIMRHIVYMAERKARKDLEGYEGPWFDRG